VSRTWVDAALSSARVGRLATVGDDGVVHVVPFCFAVVTGLVVSAVDHKPKRTARLQRLRDIESSGRATVLVDHYEEDWSRLWWIRVVGRAAVHERGSDVDVAARRALVEKYAQYARQEPTGPVYSIAIDEVSAWRGDEGVTLDDVGQ
jgi:PPOX class probable F420-dependent enzyme